jgi:hypothetical protein
MSTQEVIYIGDRLIAAGNSDAQVTSPDHAARGTAKPFEVTKKRGSVEVKLFRQSLHLRNRLGVFRRAEISKRVTRVCRQHVDNKGRYQQHSESCEKAPRNETNHVFPPTTSLLKPTVLQS